MFVTQKMALHATEASLNLLCVQRRKDERHASECIVGTIGGIMISCEETCSIVRISVFSFLRPVVASKFRFPWELFHMYLSCSYK